MDIFSMFSGELFHAITTSTILSNSTCVDLYSKNDIDIKTVSIGCENLNKYGFLRVIYIAHAMKIFDVGDNHLRRDLISSVINASVVQSIGLNIKNKWRDVQHIVVYADEKTLSIYREALNVADFLSVHVPLNSETRNLIGCEELSKMKTGSFIINTSRGGIINKYDLAQYISNGHIAGAGLDVMEEEPIKDKNPLFDLDNVTITPHIGMYSREAINQVSLIAAKNVIEHFKKG